MDALSHAMQVEIPRASPAGVATVFNQLSANLAAGLWLADTNQYKTDCTERIKQDLKGAGINGPHLGEYIAASIPLHCLDGWTFLARACDAYSCGSPHQAAHFAYYAELRAAMSILASQGIGVFDKHHFTINANGVCQQLTGEKATHSFVWRAIESWAGRVDSGSKLLRLFVVSNETLYDWFDGHPGFDVAATAARDWMRDWGLDLKNCDSDRDIRNLASYRPNEFSVWNSDARTCSAFLQGIWELFEPSVSSRFEKLDSQLLKRLIQRVILSQIDPGVPSTQEQATRRLDAILNSLSTNDPERSRLRKLLTSTIGLPTILQKADRSSQPIDTDVHECAMARAALLLRIASGFSAQLIDNAAFTAVDLEFWTTACAEARGFWRPGENLPLIELWEDVSAAFSEERAWQAQRSGTAISMYDWRTDRQAAIIPLAECDRAGLWSLQR